MSKKNDLVLLSQFIEQNYVIPYTHDELLDLLERIARGHILSEKEYELFRKVILGDVDVNGESVFSGDYNDLINKPDIPKNMADLKDYYSLMARFNQLFSALEEKDKELSEQVSSNASFLSALEVVLYNDVEEIKKLVEACTLLDGESLSNVIQSIKEELGWLDLLRTDIQIGKVLSERDFKAIYDDVLKSITDTVGGLTGYINNVILTSIVDPGKPNTDGNVRLDSIGEALAQKVDKVYGYGLSENDFSNKYKSILDIVINHTDASGEGDGSLRTYIEHIIDFKVDEFGVIINNLEVQIREKTENQIQELEEYLAKETQEMKDTINQYRQDTLDGVAFVLGDGPASVSIGGFKKGDKLEGLTVRDALIRMLCPFVEPAINARLVLNKDQTIFRIEEIIQVRKIVADIDTGSLPIRRVSFYRSTGGGYEKLADQNNYQSNYKIFNFPDLEEYSETIESGHFMIEVETLKGEEGEEYIFKAYTPEITVVCPIFSGVIDEKAEITEQLLKGQKNDANNKMKEILSSYWQDHTVRYDTKSQRMLFAIPKGYGSLSRIVDQNGYDITSSFEICTVPVTFKMNKVFNGIISTIEKEVEYTVFYGIPSTVHDFEVTYRFE